LYGSEGGTEKEKGKFGLRDFTHRHTIYAKQLPPKSRNTFTEIFFFYFSLLFYFGRQAHMSV
jgi:hypothetical protein